MAYYTRGKILAESIPVLTVLVAIGVAAGQLLATSEDALLAVPVLLAIVVPINAASGMVGAVLGSRVSTGLHTGSLLGNKALQFRRDVAATFILGAAVFGTLALFGMLLAVVDQSGTASLFRNLLLIVAGTAGILIAGMVLLVIVLGALSFRMGWDPDNVVVPTVTTGGDLLGITSFILMVNWVGL